MSAQGETWQTSSNRKQDTRTRLAWLPCVMTSLRPATLPGHPWQTKTDLRRMFRRRSGTRVLAPPSKYAFSVCTTALSSPSTTFSVSCISHSYPLLLAMSTSLRTTNKPGNPSDDLPIRTGDGQEHDSSDGGGIPPAEAGQGDNPSQVWLSSSRTEQKYTIRHCIGVGGANKQATGATSLGNRQDSPGDY